MDWSKFARKTPRLEGWNYAAGGWYFVTICTHQHHCFFGLVENETVHLSPTGIIARDCWLQIPDHVANVYLDEFVVMPNHIHGILAIDDGVNAQIAGNSFTAPVSGSLGRIINSYKGAVTRLSRLQGDVGFRWQAKYFDHIIRNDKSLRAIREYINTNPLRWELEKNSPENIGELQ